MEGAGRYAPSPTGELHLGNLRTAVLAWLFARSTGRRFLLRFEDLDRQRSKPEYARQQLADLTSLGLDFDGPVLSQSTRDEHYQAALDRLGDQTYECFCTRREIAEAASAPHGELDGAYPGICRELTKAEQNQRRAAGRPAALRLRANQAVMTVTDLLQGDYSGVVDDFVLRRNDGGWAYNLAVVVDDAATGVDQVVRGDDLLSSAPRQAYLATLLGEQPPSYLHVPLALNRTGARLAKRDGAVTLSDLASCQLGPAEVLSLIAHSLGLAAAAEPVTAALLLDRFDPTRLPREPWVPELPLSSGQ